MRRDDGKITGSVHGLDANSLYLGCTQSDMMTGAPKVFHVKDGKLHERAPVGSSMMANEYLEYIKSTEANDLETVLNKGWYNIYIFCKII